MEMALIASFCTDCDTKQKSKNSQNIYIEFSFFLVILIAWTFVGPMDVGHSFLLQGALPLSG